MKTFRQILADVGHTDKDNGHSYGWCYDAWFAPLRHQAVNVLEIGVSYFGGGSVLALSEYFEQGTIWGLDNDWSPCAEAVMVHPRIRCINADAFDQTAIAWFCDTRFDVIIEDVHPHETEDQLRLFHLYRRLLAPDGFYVIEDCTTREWLTRLSEIWRFGYRQTIVDMSREGLDTIPQRWYTVKNVIMRLDKV